MKAIFYRFCNILWFISVATVVCTFLSYFYQLNNANECADKQKIADKNYSIAQEKYEKELLAAKAWYAKANPPQDVQNTQSTQSVNPYAQFDKPSQKNEQQSDFDPAAPSGTENIDPAEMAKAKAWYAQQQANNNLDENGVPIDPVEMAKAKAWYAAQQAAELLANPPHPHPRQERLDAAKKPLENQDSLKQGSVTNPFEQSMKGDESTKEPEAESLNCSSFGGLTGSHLAVLLFPIFIFLFIYVITGYIFKRPKLEVNKP